MKETELKKSTTETLIKQQKSQQFLVGLLAVLTIALLFFPIRDYLNGIESKSLDFIMPLCCLGGMFSLFPQIKAIKQELKLRNQ